MPATAAALLVGATLALPPGAAADVTGDANVSLSPAVADKPSRLTVTATGQATTNGEQAPNAISVRVARGFRVDPRAVAETCSDDQRKALACPAASKVGSGSAEGSAAFIGQTFAFRATIEAFLMAPIKSGDLAGVAMIVREQNTGRQGSGRGRVIDLGKAGGPYGLELLLEELGTRQLPIGASARLDRFELTVGAQRYVRRKVTVRKRVKTRRGKRIRRKRVVRRRRHDLLRNPEACNGSWPYQLRATFPSAPEQVREGSVACSRR